MSVELISSGGMDRVTIRVASIVPFFVMKGMALDELLKEKDAWDIYYCTLAYPGGIEALRKNSGLISPMVWLRKD
jgi:hypothetical protein